MRQTPTSQQRAIGARIRVARQAARLTQAALGARLAPPVSHAAVSDLERGKSTYPAALLADLARITGTSVRALYDGVRDDPQGVRQVMTDAQVNRLGGVVRNLEAVLRAVRPLKADGGEIAILLSGTGLDTDLVVCLGMLSDVMRVACKMSGKGIDDGD